MQVLFVTSEVHPFSKTGGLADVAGALPNTLVRLGANVTVISPWYAKLAGTPVNVGNFQFGNQQCRVGQLQHDGVRYVFVGSQDFDRDTFYGYDDDVRRFAQFCAVVPLVVGLLKLDADVVHLNDWQTGLLAPILRTTKITSVLQRASIVYTVHNLQYQGRWNIPDILTWTGLTDLTQGFEFHGDASSAKAGMVFSDAITTVSPTYAREIQTPQMGFGLDGVLRERGVIGVLNGIDTNYWNPALDPLLKTQYADFAHKAQARHALILELGLEPTQPILAMVTRLVDQKGLDLVMSGLGKIVKDWNLVVLGSGETRYAGPLEALGAVLPTRVAFDARFNEPFAHRIYAGADAFLMPSLFEPCGLSQMIAMRYGTIPIVRRTGGLVDTVPDALGYGFRAYSSAAMIDTLRQARGSWNTATWDAKAQAGMMTDFSWNGPATEYLNLYARLQSGIE